MGTATKNLRSAMAGRRNDLRFFAPLRMKFSDIEVSEVTSRRERDAFIKFQWQIYDSNPAWEPPLIIERKAFLDRKHHPFYRHGDAALFLARQNGKILGRIMASDDPNYTSLH